MIAVLLRLLDWLNALRHEQPVTRASARLCTQSHLLIYVGGAPDPPVARHVDVELELHKRRGAPISVFELERAELNGEELHEVWSDFRPVTIEAGQPPVTSDLSLGHRDDRPVEASPGDRVKLSFRWTHRRPLRVTATIDR